MDEKWWEEHYAEALRTFHGERCTTASLYSRRRVHRLKRSALLHFNNSGSGTIALAAFGGARTVLLLGFDFQHTGGQRHWHGDHPRTLGNARSVLRWHECMPGILAGLEAAEIETWNCTRETALKWPRLGLENALDRARAREVSPDVGAGEVPRALPRASALAAGAHLAAP